MNPEKDYYAVLGILPDAEVVVVVAAYRALASLYHPDKWKGEVSEATRRMAEINVAYGVLGDAAKRKEYDASRKSSHSSFESTDAAQDAAFDEALSEVEERWQIAVRIFPDLTETRKKLAKTAHRLAFAFVTVMLESKLFKDRQAVADAMENKFLELHFGTNKEVIAFAKELIQLGLKDAIIALNRYVDVLGSDIDPAPFIRRVEMDFNVGEARKVFRTDTAASRKYEVESQQREELRKRLRNFRDSSDAVRLAELSGYDVSFLRHAQRQSAIYVGRLKGTGRTVFEFYSENEFVEWVVASLCGG